MANTISFPLLNADQIEVKVKQITASGAVLLLYKTARTDRDILDEIVGPMKWKDDYKEIKGNLYCGIAILDTERNEWVWKWDCGIESRADGDGNEKKGEASDAFKRAGFCWGIGRELYTSPFTFAKVDTVQSERGRGYELKDKFMRFDVQEIGYNEHREINRLVIVNSKTHNVVFEFGTNGQNRPKQQPKPKAKEEPAQEQKTASTGISGAVATPEQIEYIKAHASDDDYMDIMTRYGANLENLSQADAEREIAEIDKHNEPMIPTCERCGKAITGVALPDGSRMTASELIGKSKLTYNGVYCFGCMKELSRKKKAG